MVQFGLGDAKMMKKFLCYCTGRLEAVNDFSLCLAELLGGRDINKSVALMGQDRKPLPLAIDSSMLHYDIDIMWSIAASP